MAGRAPAGAAGDRPARLGSPGGDTRVAQWPGCPGAFGRALLGLVGDGWLERLYLVPDVAAAGLLGASAAGHRSHDRARWTLPRDWGSLAGAGPADVPVVGSGPREDV